MTFSMMQVHWVGLMPSLLCNDRIGSHPGQSNMYIKILIINQIHYMFHFNLLISSPANCLSIDPVTFIYHKSHEQLKFLFILIIFRGIICTHSSQCCLNQIKRFNARQGRQHSLMSYDIVCGKIPSDCMQVLPQ